MQVPGALREPHCVRPAVQIVDATGALEAEGLSARWTNNGNDSHTYTLPCAPMLEHPDLIDGAIWMRCVCAFVACVHLGAAGWCVHLVAAWADSRCAHSFRPLSACKVML